MSKFLLKYSESKDAMFFTLQDNGNEYYIDTNPTQIIDKENVTRVVFSLFDNSTGTKSLIGDVDIVNPDAQEVFNSINSSSGLYIFLDNSLQIQLPIGKYITLDLASGIDYTAFIDGVYSIEIVVQDINLDESTFSSSDNIYLYSVIKNCIIKRIKDIDWKMYENKPCEYPLAWELDNIFRSMIYASEFDLKADYLYILDKLQKVCNICEESNISSNTPCACDDIDLIASNSLYANNINII